MAIDLNMLPTILCGPILRHVKADSVTVWVATRVACTVQLIVNDPARPTAGAVLSTPIPTRAVGRNLHAAIVTARAPEGAPFQPGTIYRYDLSVSGAAGGSVGTLTTPGVATRPGVPLEAEVFGYPGGVGNLPSFVLPASTADGLRIAHGSCRKPHANSLDALALLDAEIGANVANPTTRVQQLFLTGDQIYADDVADVLLDKIVEVARVLIGDEQLPLDAKKGPTDLRPGYRAETARVQAGFTPEKAYAKSHLLTYGEFAVMYLLVWSDVLWPQLGPFATFGTLHPGKAAKQQVGKNEFPTPLAKEFEREREALRRFVQTLRWVRRALANVATYMVLDDHEVTDDLFMNRGWVEGVISAPIGRRVLANGLAAYAVFQARGNDPAIETNPGLLSMLDALARWVEGGLPPGADADGIADAVGVPKAMPVNGEYERAGSAIPWHFRQAFPAHEVIALDTRTRRLYPGAGPHAPPALLSPDSIVEQIPASIEGRAPGAGVTFVITPGVVAGLSMIEEAQEGISAPDDILANDVELLKLDFPAFDGLMDRLASRETTGARVVFLNGDVHYGFAAALRYWGNLGRPTPGQIGTTGEVKAVFAQLVASALKNQSPPPGVVKGTLALHFGGYESSRRAITRLGWVAPGNGPSMTVGTGKWTDMFARPLPVSGESPWRVPVGRERLAVTDLTHEPRHFHTVTVTTPPGWILHAALVRQGAHPTSVVPVNDPVSLGELLRFLWDVLRNWFLGYRRVGKAGTEVVGVNNVGLVSLAWGDDLSARKVIQELHWWNESYDKLYAALDASAGKPLALPKTTTRYEVSLAQGEKPSLTDIDVFD